MAIFGFGKKKKEPEQAVPGAPIDQVMALKQQGMDNNQIIQERKGRAIIPARFLMFSIR